MEENECGEDFCVRLKMNLYCVHFGDGDRSSFMRYTMTMWCVKSIRRDFFSICFCCRFDIDEKTWHLMENNDGSSQWCKLVITMKLDTVIFMKLLIFLNFWLLKSTRIPLSFSSLINSIRIFHFNQHNEYNKKELIMHLELMNSHWV